MDAVCLIWERECVEPAAPRQPCLQVSGCALVPGIGGSETKVAQLLAHLVMEWFPSGGRVPEHTETFPHSGESL
eukprot:8701909-Prorocentrum_lima.AAC.1